MADIGEWIKANAEAATALKALVASRFHPVRLPDRATLPAATYQQVSGFPYHAMGADAGVFRATVQITTWAASYSAARAVALQVKAAFRRATGTLAGITVQHSQLINEIDTYEDGPRFYRVDQDFEICYVEA